MSFYLQAILSVITGPLTYIPALTFIFLLFFAQKKIIKALEGRLGLDRDQYYNFLIFLPMLILEVVIIAMVISIPSEEKFKLTLSAGYAAILTVVTIYFAISLTRKKSSQPIQHPAVMPNNNYIALNRWLIMITDSEFSIMLNTLREKIPSLMQLSDHVSKTDFLGAMQRWQKLEEVEIYLLATYPDRFPI